MDTFDKYMFSSINELKMTNMMASSSQRFAHARCSIMSANLDIETTSRCALNCIKLVQIIVKQKRNKKKLLVCVNVSTNITAYTVIKFVHRRKKLVSMLNMVT